MRLPRNLGKGILGVLAVLLLCLALAPKTANATNPSTISFQGKVVNADGTNVTDANYKFVFSIYSVTTGGTALWTETQTAVPVAAGVFQVSLGSVTPLTSIDFNANPSLYLGITFNSDANGEMTPRVQLQSVPYAYNADKLGGLTSAGFVQLSPTAAQSGNINLTGTGTNNITANGTIQGLNLTATGALQGASLNVDSNAFNVSASGLVTSQSTAYTTTQVLVNDGQTTAPPAYPNAYTPALSVITSQTGGSRPLFFGYNGGTIYPSFLTSGACGSFTQMCLDLGSTVGTTVTSATAFENIGTTLNIGGGDDGNFATISIAPGGGTTNVGGVLNVGGNLALTAAAAGTISGATNQALTIQSQGTGGLTLNSANGTLSIGATDSILQRIAAGTTTLDLKDTANTTLELENSSTGVANLQLYGGGLCTGAAACTTGGATMRLDNAGDLTNIVNYTSTGSTTTGSFIDSVTDTNTAGTNYPITNAATAYYLSATSTTTNAAYTTIMNITGLPATDGTIVFISATCAKGQTNGGLTARLHTCNFEIAGTIVSTVTTGNTAAAATFTRAFTVVRINGVWTVVGTGLAATPTAASNTVNTADYAEYIHYNGDPQPQPGDVLSVGSQSNTANDSTTAYDPHAIGVVSTSPYETGGADDGHSVVIALTGRVPVKVNLQNGPIAIGDDLTASSTPGEAMKATKAGHIIGHALEAYNSSQATNQINVQLGAGYDDPTAIVDTANTSNGALAIDSAVPSTTHASTSATTQTPVSASALSGAGTTTAPAVQTSSINLDSDLSFHSATLSGGLVVNGDTTFNGLTTFQKLATFIAKTVFKQDVEFDGHVSVSPDGAGYALVRKGESSVQVTFANAYATSPVVSASPTDGQFVDYSIKNITPEGFELDLHGPATQDTTLSWTAVGTLNPTTASNPLPQTADTAAAPTTQTKLATQTTTSLVTNH